MFGRYDNLKKIRQMDPVKDHKEIVRLIAYFEFPWDGVRSLEFALFRTFAVPSIGKLLYSTGEFTKRTQRRYDDTDLILSHILEFDYDSEMGKQMIAKMNKLHGQFNISNNDFLYVMSTFVMEPWRWIDKYGWRKLCEVEKQALFITWKEIGKHMNIQNLPKSFDEMEAFNINYEKTHFKFSQESLQVAKATENMFLDSLFPNWVYGVVRPFVRTFMDERLLNAFGYTPPNLFVKLFMLISMRLRASMLSFFPKRKAPIFRTKRKPVLSYPKGYKPEDLGAPLLDEF